MEEVSVPGSRESLLPVQSQLSPERCYAAHHAFDEGMHNGSPLEAAAAKRDLTKSISYLPRFKE